MREPFVKLENIQLVHPMEQRKTLMSKGTMKVDVEPKKEARIEGDRIDSGNEVSVYSHLMGAEVEHTCI